jgi:hypothetical protein
VQQVRTQRVLVDQLVGTSEQRRWNGEAERLGSRRLLVTHASTICFCGLQRMRTPLRGTISGTVYNGYSHNHELELGRNTRGWEQIELLLFS